MEVRDTHNYTQDVDTLFKYFCDSAQAQAKHEALGARNINLVKFESTDSTLNIIIEREVPADVPRAMKKFLSDWNHIKQVENWSGTPGEGYHCDISIEISGVPVTIVGTMDLAPEGSGCSNTVCLDINCGIPLVGKKLAELVASQSKTSMREEYEYVKTAVA
ncbi:DUF2505 domain-containing protein [Alkalimarinus sediminis]|uniref:DUF2505 domain-containing protein n=1 Tax=Alkalimarinus sediminis TaxID=1632866 RepID=A0A9E8HQP9_9ALTE|nr:DUF2505 domain-containing protein [Alkalimarinus sediminis]UZW74771.1 DUF2505 domain-containing protein [Alkalimarinus sediminis]